MNSTLFDECFRTRFLTQSGAESMSSRYFTESQVVSRSSSQNPPETFDRVDHPNHPRLTSNLRQGRLGTTPGVLGKGQTKGIGGC